MKQYIFQTGHGKGLAKAELEAVLKSECVEEVYDGLVFETEIEDPTALQNRLGGTVRITEVVQKGPTRLPLNFTDWTVKAVAENISHSGKGRFGLSMHPKSEKILKKILIESKKSLKNKVGSIRFVNKDFQNLSSVQAWHEKLISEQSIELHLFKGERHWYLAKTLSIQNFEWYSERDMKRPARDPREGMFPPKLAQILINLAQPEENVYDPFCGSGTLLQEAWLMGFTPHGSDFNENSVERAKKNLEWLKEKANLEGEDLLFHMDATQLEAKDLPRQPLTIVTETYLGPLLTAPPKALELPKLQRELETLYENFFSNLSQITTEPITMVFTAAYYKDKNERHFLPNLPKILSKYTQIHPLSDHERPSMFYERKNQVVGREIWKVTITKKA